MSVKKIDEQRYLWILRAMGVFAALCAVLNIVLLAAFEKAAPSKKIEAFLVQTMETDAQAMYVNSAGFGMGSGSAGRAIAKNYLIKYTVERESMYLEPSKNLALVGPDSDVAAMSSDELYAKFGESAEYGEKISNPERKIKTVSIDPINANYLNTLGYWDIEANVTTMDAAGLNRSTETKKITIEAEFAKSPIKKSGRGAWRNPLGFTVTKYEDAGRK